VSLLVRKCGLTEVSGTIERGDMIA